MSLTRQLPVLIFWASAQQHPQSITVSSYTPGRPLIAYTVLCPMSRG
jgi:hypothetical protein